MRRCRPSASSLEPGRSWTNSTGWPRRVRRCSADDPVSNPSRKQLLLMKNKDADFIQRLARSELYSEFKQALGASTGLPLTLRPVEFWQLAHRGQPHENPFCAMISRTNRG